MRSNWKPENRTKQNRLAQKRKKRRRNKVKLFLIFTIFVFCFVRGILSNINPVKGSINDEDTYKKAQSDVFAVNNKPLYNKTIVVDAGHGGLDPGTIGLSTGIYESDVNLQIANLLSENLKNNGATVIMTRTDETTQRLGQSDKLSMDEREKIIENAKADMLISIHQNFNEQSSEIKGVQVLTRSSLDTSFAAKLQEQFNTEFNIDLNYIIDEYLLLSFGNQPSFIIECGFLSNPEEEKNLQNLKHQQKIAEILTREICNYWAADNNA